MIRCLNCNAQRARVTESGLVCDGCGYEWSFEHEQANRVYIEDILGRQVVTPPAGSQQAEPEPASSAVVTSGDTGRADLTSLDGLGKKTAEKLNEIGIHSLEDLVMASVKDIVDAVDHVSDAQVWEWIEAASERLE